MSFKIGTKVIDGIEYLTSCAVTADPPDYEYIIPHPVEAELRDYTTGRLLYRVQHSAPPWSEDNPRLTFIEEHEPETVDDQQRRLAKEQEREVKSTVSFSELVDAFLAFVAGDAVPAEAIRSKLQSKGVGSGKSESA